MESQSTEFLSWPSTGFLLPSRVNFSGMGERNDRLIAARKAAGLNSAAAAAKRHHWKPSTYASHENGQTPLPARAAKRYAAAFKVSAGWLLTGEGEMRPGNRAKFVKLYERLDPEQQPRAIEFLEFLHNRRE